MRGKGGDNRVVRLIEENGFRVVKGGGGHLKVLTAAGGFVAALSCSPGDYRTHQNEVAMLRRRGVLRADQLRH